MIPESEKVMSITNREFWVILHGMLFGALYLLAFAGGAEALWSFRPGLLTVAGMRERLRRLRIGVMTMAITCWLTVLSGTYVIYAWYRRAEPGSAKSRLLADPQKAAWHSFGMEWKEHVSWLAAILTTAVAFLIFWYDEALFERQEVRRAAFWFLAFAFAAAAVGGVFGAFINKAAPIL